MNLRTQYFRHLLCDTKSLSRYFKACMQVELQDVKRDLMLIERKGNTRMPDHFYRLGQEVAFKDIKWMADLFLMGLQAVADEFLEYHGGRLFVKANKMNEWQLTIPFVPPLLLIALKIHKDGHTDVGSVSASSYIHREITPCVRHTALLCPYIAELEHLKRETGGMTDLHLHLNGAVETDTVWQDLLTHPEPVYREVAVKLAKDEKVKEQYSQLTNLTTADELLQMLHVANELRWKIFDLAFGAETEERGMSFESFLTYIKHSEDNLTKRVHPVQSLLPHSEVGLSMECYLYIKVFDAMKHQRTNDTLAGLFHYYLLILGLVNKMLVQQPFVKGFEEFQKYTSNGLREYSEYTYLRRFLQMSGNCLDNLRLIEGRFSPKPTVRKNRMKIVAGVGRGLKRLHDICEKEFGRQSTAEIFLIAHFIKQAEPEQQNDFFTFEHLRETLDQKTMALINLRFAEGQEHQSIMGIDAAASEFDTPPEVFAPYYRRLRKEGFEHFTYHAGEDFFHVLSGMRAIYEAIEFLDLRSGDRIGHATAAGVSVSLWRQNIGDELLVRQGEYMDDLLFAYHVISDYSRDAQLHALLPTLAHRIEEYSYQVYRAHHPVTLLLQAWQMRKEDPRRLLKKDDKQWNAVERLYMAYHSRAVQERYKAVVSVKTYDVFGEDELTRLQWLLLKEMYNRKIVIETLPTSNVLIGHHRDFRTYHLYNWYRWSQEHEVPPIVVGTDDAGVFATNIYNEYCNIFCMLKEHGCNADDIMAFIRKLDENARLYAFTPLP